MRRLLSVWGCVLLTLHMVNAAELYSPDGQLSFEADVSENGELEGFNVRRAGRVLLNGGFGLEVAGIGDPMKGARIEASTRRTHRSAYVQPGNIQNPVRDHYNELVIRLGGAKQVALSIDLEVRAYDDGVAFRYRVGRSGERADLELVLKRESTWFRPLGNPVAWPMYLSSYTTSHEAVYKKVNFSVIETNRLIATPLLLDGGRGKPALAITEAALRDYPGMYLRAQGTGGELRLAADFAPLPGRKATIAEMSGDQFTPWRVVMVGERAGELLESNLILNLNEPSKIEDVSWIRFGRTTWNWWNGFYPEPVDFKVGANYATQKHYIDFCADNGIEFHAIDCADANLTWYTQSKAGFAPSADADILTPRPELEFSRVLDYAKQRDVGIRLWVHWKPLSERLEEALAQYGKWGVEGLMVDFLDRDDQEMVKWSERVLEVAAKHHIRVQFHGVWKPTGRRRTYPNLVNHEGVLNLEYLKWSDLCDPEHNLIVPFTRMLAGPMDYHLGGFRNVLPGSFKATSAKPSVLGTRSHHLAMYVVYFNPVPMVCDAPTAYRNEPGFDFIQQVPTEWDESRFVAGAVGDYLVVARRSGSDWYVGAMTDWTERTVPVSLGFLSKGSYQAVRWMDIDAGAPTRVEKVRALVDAGDTLKVRMVSGGGQVIRLTPQK